MSRDWRAIVRRELGPSITSNPASDEEIVEELAQHLAQRYEDAMAGGATAEAAMQRALSELRASRHLTNELRAARATRAAAAAPPSPSRGWILADLGKDVRYAVRLLLRSPGFTFAALLTLALGIGATTAIFTVLDAVLLRRIPFADAERLVVVWETDRGSGTTREAASYPDYLDLRERAAHFSDVAAFTAGESNLTPNAGEPRRLGRLNVAERFAATLGLRPLYGRLFGAEETRPGGPRVVAISARLWEQLFQSDPAALGRTVRLDDEAYSIVGILPNEADYAVMQILTYAAYSRAFADRDRATRVDVWMPLQADERTLPRDTHPIFLVARLKSGSALQLAQRDVSGIMTDLEQTYPSNAKRGAFVESLDDVVFARVRPGLWLLFAAVGLVLLIACVNVANLLMARGTARLREVAVRTALGAQRRRLARQFAVENVLLTTAAALLGVALALAALRALISIAPADIPRLAEATLNMRLLGGAILLSVAIGLVFGMLPVIQARRLDVQQALRTEESRASSAGKGSHFTRSALVVAEVALALVLMVGAGLLLKSFWIVQRIDPGFDPDNVLKAEFQLARSRYPVDFSRYPDLVEVHRFNAELLRRSGAIPGVEQVAIAGDHPIAAGFTNSFVIVGREAESGNFPEISVRRVTGGYFATVRLALRRGDLFGDVEPRAPPVAVINETAVRAFFPGTDPIGQRIAFWGAQRSILGVVADEKIHGLTAPTPPAIYVPLQQAPSVNGSETVLVRAAVNLPGLANQLRSTVREIDPALPLFGLEPLGETVADSLQQRRFVMLLLTLFAIVAVTLSLIGIHGVLSYTVGQRRHEIGIRMALGASPGRVTALVMAYGARLAALGVVLGVAGALISSRLLGTLLFGVGSSDAATLAAAVILLGVTALVATYLPVRAAMRIDPISAVREQ